MQHSNEDQHEAPRRPGRLRPVLTALAAAAVAAAMVALPAVAQQGDQQQGDQQQQGVQQFGQQGNQQGGAQGGPVPAPGQTFEDRGQQGDATPGQFDAQTMQDLQERIELLENRVRQLESGVLSGILQSIDPNEIRPDGNTADDVRDAIDPDEARDNQQPVPNVGQNQDVTPQREAFDQAASAARQGRFDEAGKQLAGAIAQVLEEAQRSANQNR